MSQRTDLIGNKNAFNWLEKREVITEFREVIRADILIVGGGHAGIAAARSAIDANEHMNIVVIDQQKEANFRVLGNGEIGHINSKWQESCLIPRVDVAEFANDWQLRTNNRSNYGLIRKYAMNCGDTFDWMINVLSDEDIASIDAILAEPSIHMPKVLNGIRSYPGSAKMSVEIQNKMMALNRQLIQSKGGRILYNTKAYELLVEKESVVGAVVECQGHYIKIEVDKGVIIAAGDYSKNAQMCRDLLTDATDRIDQNSYWLGHGWKGDGLRLGMMAGGRMESRPHPALGGNYSFSGFEVIGATPVLRVNKHGVRYSNEGFGTHILAATAGAKQPNGMLYGIFDANIMNLIQRQSQSHAFFDYNKKERVDKLEYDLKRAREGGAEGVALSVVAGNENPNMPRRLYSAKTIKELASYLFKQREDQDNFMETVKRYNQLCKTGEDVDFGKESVLMQGVLTPPFYGVAQLKDSHKPIGQSFKLLVTVGGLLIDDNQQVLDEEYEPIKGLYATGNSSGCRFGLQYTTSLSGQSISMAHTLGREVGKYLALL